MFHGSYDHVLDDKGRTSLPKELRLELARFEGEPWLVPLDQCLAFYPAPYFDAIQRELSSQPKLRASTQSLKRLITGMAVRCPIDRQGRILIPPKARNWAGLERQIVFAGVGEYIEIWDREQHQAELEHTRENYDEYTRRLGDFEL